MHPNPVFRRVPEAQSLAFARARGFGTLSVAAAGEVLAAHLPFRLAECGTWVEMHMARSNPVLRHPGRAMLMVQGPDGYVSPDWYGADNQVPTWNYVAVHLRGALEVSEPSELRAHLERVSAAFEGPLEKRDWTLDKMEPGALARLERMIVPVRLQIETVDATWKLGQNKDETVRLAAAGQIAGSHGMEPAALAELMKTPPEDAR